jgi:HAD superfamily hydrolase (TIGR01509 family)
MKFAAAIFDLDGTIIKSEEEWGMAFIAVLQKLGIKADSDPHIPGVSLKSNWQEILVRYKIQTDKTPEELETLTYLEYEKLIPQITLNDGVLEFMDTLKESGLPLSLATSTNWQITDKILERFGLNDFFENITTGEEVINAKPAPDIFLTASEKLGVEPIDCLVFEDSPSGVTAAHDAGMKVIVVLGDGENKGKLDMADLVTGSFSEITLKAIDAISQY